MHFLVALISTHANMHSFSPKFIIKIETYSLYFQVISPGPWSKISLWLSYCILHLCLHLSSEFPLQILVVVIFDISCELSASREMADNPHKTLLAFRQIYFLKIPSVAL